MAKLQAPVTTPARSNGKHPGGRPSKYDPAYGQQLIAFMARKPYAVLRQMDGETGKISLLRQANDPPLLVDFAAKIKVTHRTLDEWAKVHPEFSLALEEAKQLQHRYYVTCGVLGVTNPTIPALIIKNNHRHK